MRAALFIALLTAAAAPPGDVVLAPNDARESVALAVGQRLDIRFAVRFSTGFSWVVGKIEGDAVAFEKSEGLYGSDAAPNAPQGVDVQRITFLARKAGAATIDFHFKRPWETAAKPQEVRRLSVRVE